MSKISRVLTRRRPRKPVLRHSPSSLAAAERVAAREKEAAAAEAPAPTHTATTRRTGRAHVAEPERRFSEI